MLFGRAQPVQCGVKDVMQAFNKEVQDKLRQAGAACQNAVFEANKWTGAKCCSQPAVTISIATRLKALSEL
eukprot:1157323-Pelagomonas_calceolata.AAC.8